MKRTKEEQNNQKNGINKTFMLIISCWLFFILFVTLRGGGG